MNHETDTSNKWILLTFITEKMFLISRCIVIPNKGDQLIDLFWSDGPADRFPSDLLFLLSSLVLFLFLSMAAACLFILLLYYIFILVLLSFIPSIF